MPRRVQVSLTTQDRLDLIDLTPKGTARARTMTRAQILLLADCSQDERRTHQAIAEGLGCSANRVSNVVRRYADEGLQGALYERSRPGAPPKIDPITEAQLVMLACSAPPEGRNGQAEVSRTFHGEVFEAPDPR